MIKHLALIMDGNRRWAKKRLLTPWKGHQEGVQAAQKVLNYCLNKQIKYLSLYTFSLENFNRSPEEKSFLFEILAHEAHKRLSELIIKGIRICFIGDRSLFPASVQSTIEEVEHETKHLDTLQVNLLFCYGGQQEIAHACKAIAQDVQAGIIKLDQINDTLVNSYLWTGAIPEPELIIRTGGRNRLSNFLLFQAAYSELYFLDCLWPDIQENDLDTALGYFEEVTRNFGA
ncbi:MAG: polyprenyl diphosphate synthase [Candidatus Babeliales bacterium]